jgi:hypothetical protein
MHRYGSTIVPEGEVEWLESELGVNLPSEYRAFLTEIGYGAGPYYGIWSPGKALDEIQSLSQEMQAEVGIEAWAFDPFPIPAPAVPRVVRATWPASGCLPICHEGCTAWAVLCLQGEFAGCVWDVVCLSGYNGDWVPAQRPPGCLKFPIRGPIGWRSKWLPRLPEPPSFAQWFDGWLDRCLADLGP